MKRIFLAFALGLGLIPVGLAEESLPDSLSGSWYSSKGKGNGSLSLKDLAINGSKLSGKIYFGGTSCSTGFTPISGTFDGNSMEFTSQISCGRIKLNLSGSGKKWNGDYKILRDRGTISLSE